MRLRHDMVDYLLHSHDMFSYSDVIIIPIIPILWWRYLLDRFGVGDLFYHELAMLNPSLPRSHTVKDARTQLDSKLDIFRTPAPYNGAYRSFKVTLVTELGRMVSKINSYTWNWSYNLLVNIHLSLTQKVLHPQKFAPGCQLRIKISADEATFSLQVLPISHTAHSQGCFHFLPHLLQYSQWTAYKVLMLRDSLDRKKGCHEA